MRLFKCLTFTFALSAASQHMYACEYLVDTTSIRPLFTYSTDQANWANWANANELAGTGRLEDWKAGTLKLCGVLPRD